MNSDSGGNARAGGGWQLTAIAIILIVASVTHMGPILKPLFTAFFVFFLIRPAAEWMKGRGLAGWLAYLILFSVATAALALFLAVLTSNAGRFKLALPAYEDRFFALAAEWHQEARIREAFDVVTPREVFGSVVAPAASAAEFAVVFAFYLLFLILSVPKIPDRVRRSFPPERADHLLRIGRAVADGMSKYMKIKTAINAGLAATVGAVLAAFGIDYWLLWALLILALNYITYVGAVAALIPPALLGFVQLSTPWAAALAAILVLIRFVWIDLLEVRLSGKSLNIDSILLLVFMAYWGWVWGVVGLLLAMPMATCLRAGLAADARTRPFAGLMSEELGPGGFVGD